MSDWQERYECFLLLNAKRSTFRRYARALDRFFDMNQGKVYGYQFLRPVIIDYVQARLAQGASVSTVRLEMAAVRGLFAYMIQMGAVDVMFNPAANVKIKKPEDRLTAKHGSEIAPTSAPSLTYRTPGPKISAHDWKDHLALPDR